MIKGTKTEKNLLKAFAGESQARTRYTKFASVARKEGFEQIANLFIETANNEYEHATLFFNHLEGGPVEITATYPAGKVGTTLENLAQAANGEQEEHAVLYPEFAKVAREEGFNDIANLFEKIATIERNHEIRYRKLYDNVRTNKVFQKDIPQIWQCLECGYQVEGTAAPEICPVCSHPQSFYQLKCENY
ncbi:MAG: rubrerythrin [Bacilli bacterium]|jgi:rubrerythrin